MRRLRWRYCSELQAWNVSLPGTPYRSCNTYWTRQDGRCGDTLTELYYRLRGIEGARQFPKSPEDVSKASEFVRRHNLQ